MTKEQPASIATASIRRRLYDLSRERGEDFQLILTWYAAERLLYRLSLSKHSREFILKGAMLLNVWMDRSHRPTRALDFAGQGDFSPEHLITVFDEICQVEAEPDGLQFDPASIQATEILEFHVYQGQRIRLIANLGKARINVQVDIGFGDAVTPEARQITYPTLLDLPEPLILAYPVETVVAEKLQAMIVLGMLNTRMKDFYDVSMISREFRFEGPTLAEAIRVTFDRRHTEIPESIPSALSDEFAMDTGKGIQWKAFLKRSGLERIPVELPQVVDELRVFLIPPLNAAGRGLDFNFYWMKGGPWSTVAEKD
ncbi:MAG: nucleotidyl transferase AbiEii/AbiGii toxin family protein [Deltaproteobacteria bacterium]|nr:nucleotidyl transferase AbiEii/AbiGii toxin family protein [Deltaproteobacteria bacterium]